MAIKSIKYRNIMYQICSFTNNLYKSY